jgi:hypothetical protein
MKNYPISIPNADTKPKHIRKRVDSITVTNVGASTLLFWFDDQTEFVDTTTQQPIGMITMDPQDSFTAVAQKAEEVHYSYTDDEDAVRSLQSGVRTIVVSSTTLLDFASFEETLKSDPPLKELFCKCWPCAESLLKALVEKLPIPIPVKDFLEHLFDIGDKAYKKLCQK